MPLTALKKRSYCRDGSPNCRDSLELVCPACALVLDEDVDAMVDETKQKCPGCGQLFHCRPKILIYFTTKKLSPVEAKELDCVDLTKRQRERERA